VGLDEIEIVLNGVEVATDLTGPKDCSFSKMHG